MIIAAIVLKHSLKGFHALPLPWNILYFIVATPGSNGM